MMECILDFTRDKKSLDESKFPLYLATRGQNKAFLFGQLFLGLMQILLQ